MEKERLILLLDLVKKVNTKYRNMQVEITVGSFWEQISIWNEKEDENGVNYLVYSDDSLRKPYKNGNIQSVYDRDLVQAEAHLTRFLKEGGDVWGKVLFR